MVSFPKLVLLTVAAVALTCAPVAHASQDHVQAAPRRLQGWRKAKRSMDDTPIESADPLSTESSDNSVASGATGGFTPATLGDTTLTETRDAEADNATAEYPEGQYY